MTVRSLNHFLLGIVLITNTLAANALAPPTTNLQTARSFTLLFILLPIVPATDLTLAALSSIVRRALANATLELTMIVTPLASIIIVVLLARRHIMLAVTLTKRVNVDRGSVRTVQGGTN